MKRFSLLLILVGLIGLVVTTRELQQRRTTNSKAAGAAILDASQSYWVDAQAYLDAGADIYLAWQYSALPGSPVESDRFSFFTNGPTCTVLQQLALKYPRRIGINIWNYPERYANAIDLNYLKNYCGTSVIRFFASTNIDKDIGSLRALKNAGIKAVLTLSNFAIDENIYKNIPTWFTNGYFTPGGNYTGTDGYRGFATTLMNQIKAQSDGAELLANIYTVELSNEPHCGNLTEVIIPYKNWANDMANRLYPFVGNRIAIGQMTAYKNGRCDTPQMSLSGYKTDFEESNTSSYIGFTSGHHYESSSSETNLVALSKTRRLLGKKFYIGEAGFDNYVPTIASISVNPATAGLGPAAANVSSGTTLADGQIISPSQGPVTILTNFAASDVTELDLIVDGDSYQRILPAAGSSFLTSPQYLSWNPNGMKTGLHSLAAVSYSVLSGKVKSVQTQWHYLNYKADTTGLPFFGMLSTINSAGGVSGCAVNPDSPGASSLAVGYLIDAAYTGQAFVGTALVNSSDLLTNNCNYPGNNHGFSFQLPEIYKDGEVHTINVYAYDSRYPATTANVTQLVTNPKTFVLISPLSPTSTPPATAPTDPLFGNFVSDLPDMGPAQFSFSYSGSGALAYQVDLATTADMSNAVYQKFGTGSKSPIREINVTKWGSYKAGTTLYWRVGKIDTSNTEVSVSSIQKAVVYASPTATPTFVPTLTPTPTPVLPVLLNKCRISTNQVGSFWAGTGVNYDPVITLNGNIPVSLPHALVDVNPGTYTLSTADRSGISGYPKMVTGYTTCTNSELCHNKAPTSGSSITFSCPAGKTVSVWFHYGNSSLVPTVTLGINGTNVIITDPQVPLSLSWSSNGLRCFSYSNYDWQQGPILPASGQLSILVSRKEVTSYFMQCYDNALPGTVKVVQVDSRGIPPKGSLESVNGTNCSLTGWACDASDYTLGVPVSIYVGNTLIGTTTATIPRADLLAKQICGTTTAHGFTFMVPNIYKDYLSRTYTVYGLGINQLNEIDGVGSSLTNSGKSMTCSDLPACVPSLVSAISQNPNNPATAGNYTLTWQGCYGNSPHYQYQVQIGSNGTWKTPSIPLSSLTLMVKTQRDGTKWTWRVRSCSVVGSKADCTNKASKWSGAGLLQPSP